jgi:16S rRNA processing protein RimM
MSLNWDDMVLVGRIARAHGIRGQVIVAAETDFPEERYRPGSVVYIRRGAGDGPIEPLTITAVRFHRGRPIIQLEGVDTMNAAEELAGHDLRVSTEALQPLPPGMFYHHDLVGCAVETPEGLPIGAVIRVEGAGEGSRLVVQGRGLEEVLIPMNDAIIVGVHVAGRRIVVQPPDGLLDVNVTRKQKV